MTAIASEPTAGRVGRASCSPLLKWAGGKSALLPALMRWVPPTFRTYFEPFCGGASLFFHLNPPRAALGDANREIIATYTTVRQDTEAVIRRLKLMEGKHAWSDVRADDPHYYYQVRYTWNHEPQTWNRVQRAAALLYLNRTCWNGLWRVNRDGLFNVPLGRYKAPAICDAKRIRACARALEGVSLDDRPWQHTLRWVAPGDFVYLDPPYVPVSISADFTSYTAGGFGQDQQEEIAQHAHKMVSDGVFVLASNSDTPLVRRLYRGMKLVRVKARRSINSDATRRGPVNELIIVGRPGDPEGVTVQTAFPMEGAGPAAIGGRRVVASISGGKDSAAMSLYLKEQGVDHDRVFMDTGWEHPATYEYLRGPLTRALGAIVEIRGDLDFVQLVTRKGLFPSRVMRFCTTELKVLPVQRYLATFDEDVVNAVGIRRQESRPRSTMKEWEWSDSFDCWVWRPIVTWSLDDVVEIHRRHGLAMNPLYGMGASRVGCWPCIHARKSELALVAQQDPDRIDLIERLERGLNERGMERDEKVGRAWVPRSMFSWHGSGPHIPISIREAVDWSRSARGEWQPPGAGDGCARFGVCSVESEETP